MQDIAVCERLWIPIQVDGCEMCTHGFKVDPKDAIVILFCNIRIVVERAFQFMGPSCCIKMTKRSTPSFVTPWILDLHKAFALNCFDINDSIGMRRYQSKMICFFFRHFTRRNRNQNITYIPYEYACFSLHSRSYLPYFDPSRIRSHTLSDTKCLLEVFLVIMITHKHNNLLVDENMLRNPTGEGTVSILLEIGKQSFRFCFVVILAISQSPSSYKQIWVPL